MCYDGVKYDYEESETAEAEETLNEPSNISLWEVKTKFCDFFWLEQNF